MTEAQWDRKIKVHTIGRVADHEDVNHYPYEPTPYSVLERLAESGYLSKDSHVVDYGCGKGRVGFYLNYACGCRVTGVECNEEIYLRAKENEKSYSRNRSVNFVCTGAETFAVEEDVTDFYFFNPFSVKILGKVMGRIKDSYYSAPRPMQFFFYYPNDEYVAYLMTEEELSFADEIDCSDLFVGANSRERILIFEMG
ncbi:MAG: class I SAM-dependent methyltransferase [Lachnospiraceae bacterium]|nr:class I SAM-dependent methyltransferase [Lachnospiraceae bacterium]